jgi:orotidine-5'-phosphate decarboxylase
VTTPITYIPPTYLQKLHTAWTVQDSMLCVGLDPDVKRYPAHLADKPNKVYEFCKSIVDSTAPYACAFKPQIAYFSAQSAESQLEDLCSYIRTYYPQHLLILDSKRGDIGDTAKQYAVESFERYQADAVTINPYMGFDSVEPYLAYKNKGVIILCRTSNQGGNDFQSLALNTNERLYEYIAHLIVTQWNKNQQLSLVVGATFPAELARVRQIVGTMPLLVPGIGAQGGDIQATINAGSVEKNPLSYGMMINSSRAIMYASSGLDFAHVAASVAKQTRDLIRQAQHRLTL